MRNGSVCRAITSSTPNDGSYTWTTDQCSSYESGYRIRVWDNSSGVYDQSNSDFSIPDQVTQCSITVTEPNSGSSWNAGTNQPIRWNSSNAGSSVSILLYKDGSNQRTITDNTANDGYYLWEVNDFDQGSGSGYLIKVSDAIETSCWGNSDHFTITVVVETAFIRFGAELSSDEFWYVTNIPLSYLDGLHLDKDNDTDVENSHLCSSVSRTFHCNPTLLSDAEFNLDNLRINQYMTSSIDVSCSAYALSTSFPQLEVDHGINDEPACDNLDNPLNESCQTLSGRVCSSDIPDNTPDIKIGADSGLLGLNDSVWYSSVLFTFNGWTVQKQDESYRGTGPIYTIEE